MITLLAFIILIVLGIVALVDIKYKEIPSIFLTGMLFVILFFNFNNLQFGLIAFVLAYMLYEGSFIFGIADIKMITLVGFMLNSYFYMAIFILLILVLGIAEKFFIKYKLKRDGDFAFTPIIFITYLILLIIGGVAL